nr:putative capsid protein [Crucivirus sp.]
MPRASVSARRPARPPAARPMVRAAPKKRVPRAPSERKSSYSYDNPGPVGRVGRIAGRALGTYLGGPMGGAAGDALGGMAHYIGKVFGSGDYITNADRVKRNVLTNDVQIPQFGSDKNVVHIRHREFLGDVISSSSANTFQVQSYAIQPGQSASFPWLSNVVGVNFQQYRVNGMLYEFRSMSSDALNSTNTALGSVVMATDYDSADSAFTTKQQMENTEFGVSCKPSCSMIHAIECARSQTAVSEQYVRPGAVPSNADIRLYDLGKFYIATTGMQGTNVNLGELWVTYDITFFKAIQLSPGLSIPSAYYPISLTNAGTLPFLVAGSAGPIPAVDTIGLTFAANSLSFSFPISIPLNSVWVVSWSGVGTAANATAQTSFVLSNGFVNAVTALGLRGYFSPNPTAVSANTTGVSVTEFIQYTGGATPNALPTVALLAFTTPLATYTFCDLGVTMINGGL